MNKKSLPKRHHFVPQMLLRRFVDKKGFLHYFDKRSASRGVIAGSPQNLFLETHLYTFEYKDGTKDTELEAFFAELEGIANEIIEKIVTAARQGRKPSLTDEERVSWNLFFYYQWKRSPDYFKKIPSLVDIEGTYQKALSEYESRRPLSEEERRNLNDPATRKRIEKGATVQALADPGLLVQTFLNQKGLCFLVSQRENKSFVIGSNPVLRLIPEGSTLANPAAEVWLPIAHDVLVGPAPIPPQEEIVIMLSDYTRIRYINEAIFQQSKAIAGRSMALISSLAGIH